MIRINLPHGLRYKIEMKSSGIITPGSDNEPVITIYGPETHLQYRLISFTEVEETYKGSLTDKDKLLIEDEIGEKRPKLLVEAKIMHYVKFADDSQCYYDFYTEQLYGACGIREKKGPINGTPFRPSPNVRDFIEKLTEVPGAKIDVLEILENNGSSEESFRTIWGNFRKLDPSIRRTFSNVSRGFCIYDGNAPIWQVGNEKGDTDLTLYAIFTAVAYRKIVASIDKPNQKFNASLLDEIEMENILTFLGLDADVFDPSLIEVEKLITRNYCDSAEFFTSLIDRYTDILDGVWNHLKKNIETNLSYTFSASSYFEETQIIPAKVGDLKLYFIPVRSQRWNNALERACSSVKNIIQSTRVGVDFFANCKAEVNPDKVIDYIAAIVLASIYYCKTPTNGDNGSAIKARYSQKLRELIRGNFGYVSPSNGGESLVDPEALRIELQDLFALRGQLLSDGLYAYASVIEKFFDGLKLSYNDENSLLPPSRGREL